MPRILLVTPPMTQLNTPYPATAYLTGFLRGRGFDVVQSDPALELVLRLFSRNGLERVAGALPTRNRLPQIARFADRLGDYLATVDAVVRFLQGRDPSLALRIVSRQYLPEGPRFAAVDQEGPWTETHGDSLGWAFGGLGIQDQAKYLASLYIDDLADVVREGVDSRFELSRYGERLAASVPTFDPLLRELAAAPSLVDTILDEITRELMARHSPEFVGMSAPFPGNVYGAFRMAQTIRAVAPGTRIALGGGYVNTELRELADARVFDFFDYLTLDDGERPFLALLDNLDREAAGEAFAPVYLRTMLREDGAVRLRSTPGLHDIPQKDAGTPTYDGLRIGDYLSLFEMLNPMHRIWSDGRWNKLTLAHGCYWKKCSFCDVSLDYIGRYDPSSADLIVDRMVALIAETGQSGFHFVDEAAPPALLRALAERLLERRVTVTWWGNIRFEKTFTPELCSLLARSGCVAVSGGLEVASDRLLKLMNKGVTVEQVARVTRAFADAGVMVHAYLMFGFPTQTEQETVDALERVRQLFAAGCIQSAYWHRFAVTAHSPIGRAPQQFGITVTERLPANGAPRFARNDLDFVDPIGVDHDALGVGLRRALYNYMHGAGLDEDAQFWFEHEVPRAKVPRDLVEAALRGEAPGAGNRPGLRSVPNKAAQRTRRR
jgi:hypothetical protein